MNDDYSDLAHLSDLRVIDAAGETVFQGGIVRPPAPILIHGPETIIPNGGGPK